MSKYFIGGLQEMAVGKRRRRKRKKRCQHPNDGGVSFPELVLRLGALAAVMNCINPARCLRFLYEAAARLRAHTA